MLPPPDRPGALTSRTLPGWSLRLSAGASPREGRCSHLSQVCPVRGPRPGHCAHLLRPSSQPPSPRHPGLIRLSPVWTQGIGSAVSGQHVLACSGGAELLPAPSGLHCGPSTTGMWLWARPVAMVLLPSPRASPSLCPELPWTSGCDASPTPEFAVLGCKACASRGWTLLQNGAKFLKQGILRFLFFFFCFFIFSSTS